MAEQVPEWKLTDEEIEQAWRSLTGDYVSHNDMDRAVAQAQAKKLVEWQDEPCFKHKQTRIVPRRLCKACLQELRRQVGL